MNAKQLGGIRAQAAEIIEALGGVLLCSRLAHDYELNPNPDPLLRTALRASHMETANRNVQALQESAARMGLKIGGLTDQAQAEEKAAIAAVNERAS